MESGMLVLLLLLGGIMVYMVFSPTSLIGPWLDKYCREEKRKWGGEDITPDYNTNQDKQNIHDAISQDEPFNDPEVPNRPSKPKKTKRKYKKRSKK